MLVTTHFHQFKEKNLDFYSDFMVFLIFMKPNITDYTCNSVNGRPVLSNVVGIAKKSYNSLQLAVLINILVF